MSDDPQYGAMLEGCERVAVGAVKNQRGGYDWADIPAVVLLPSQAAPDIEPETTRSDVEFWAVYMWYSRDDSMHLLTVRDQAGGPSGLPFSAVWNLVWFHPWQKVYPALEAWRAHTGGVRK